MADAQTLERVVPSDPLQRGLLVSCVPIPPYDPVLAQGAYVQQEGAGAMPAVTATCGGAGSPGRS